ncbi:unnamed protein product [Schistosoma rodhaini]|uniref:Tubulin epsilon and delta complex protein 1 domain-containing protein n=1 Tax=Schistosoma rodhaini TaxID=6188 RepID=A0AA85G4W7_9TREM|nr:unnamed protein product [Schistosoma rodhaini]
MSGPVDIKHCIKIFVNLLKSVGFSELEAESVRLAKFDDIRAVHSIKRLVFEILYFIKYGCVDELCSEGFEKFSDNEIHQFIFQSLLKYGFPLIRRNVDENFTSRQLLLGSIWILVSFDVLPKIEQILTSTAVRMIKEKVFHQNEPIFTTCPGSNMSISRLIWLLGRLRIHLKNLYHLRETKTLPPSHCWVLLDSNAFRQHIHNVQESVSKLHLLLSWREVNHRFWQWIRSILIVHEKNLAETLPNKWVSNSACEFIELVTRLYDAKSGPCKNFTLSENFNSTEDILSCLHKELLILTDLLMCENFPIDTGLMPYDFHYNIVNDEEKLSEKQNKSGLNFTLENECAKLKLLVDKLKTEYEGVKYNLSQELQKAGADILPGANNVSLRMKESVGFQYIDRDRLLLAVQVAKRDVRCLSSSKIEDDGYIPETAQSFNNNSLLSPVDNRLVQKPTQVIRSTDQKYKSILSKPRILPSRNDFYQTTRKLAANTQYQTLDDKAPACSDSPPIRDTDTWTPNRKHALHEPTEKQLRNSQESRIRQLQAKLSQYSAALEELQAKCLSNNAQSQELGSTCKVQKKPLLKIPVNHSKSVISSIIRPKSSATRSHLVCRPNTQHSSKIIKSNSFNGVDLTHDNCPISTTSISTNARDHYDSKVSSLWEQAINSLNLDGSSAVTCQPGEYLKNQSPVKSLCGITGDQNIWNSSNQLTINTIKSNLDDCRVLCSAAKELLKQIDEAELEENAIRQRWANKLTYIHDDRKLLNNFSLTKKDDSICKHYKSDVLSLPSDKSLLQPNDKSLIRSDTSTFQFPKVIVRLF